MTESAEGFRTSVGNGVATLSLCRPEVGNAISPAMVTPLTDFLAGLSRDGNVRCLVIRGEGRHFSSGGDVAGFAAMLAQGPDALRLEFDKRLSATAGLVEAFMAVEQPVVATVRGAVAGAGLMFTLGADLVLADETAMFLFSHQRIGLPPDGGVSWLLPRIVGRRIATRLVLTAARVDGLEALDLGLVSQLIASDDLDAETERLAFQLAAAPNNALRRAKALLSRSEITTLSEQLASERNAVVDCVGGNDFAEGVRAFMEKRAPRFSSAPG